MKKLIFISLGFVLAHSGFSQIIPSSFKPPIVFDIPDRGSNSSADILEVADLDGDGKTDIIAADQFRGSIYLYQNTFGGGLLTTESFRARIDMQASATTFYISGTAVADIDGDGKPEILFSNSTTPCNTNGFGIIRNLSSPGNLSSADFAAPIFFETGGCQTDITVADMDGDTKPDVIVVAPFNLFVLRNTSSPGSISFAEPVSYSTLLKIRGKLHVADLDTDGKQDILVGYSSDGRNDSISVFLNTSVRASISLAAREDIFIGDNVNPWHIKTHDFDEDGKPEVVVSNRLDGIAVLKNNSRSGFVAMTIQAGFDKIGEVGTQPNDIQLADMDGDGFMDVIGTSQGYASFGIVKSNKSNIDSSMFDSPVSFGMKRGTIISYSDLKIADFNQDNLPDVAVMYRDKLAIYQNQFRKPPVIASLSSYSAKAGEVVAIRGNYFDPAIENNIVLFGQVEGQIINASQNLIEVEVPLGASLDFIAVITHGLTALSGRKFIPVFEGGTTVDQNTYASAITFPTSRNPQNSLSIADLDLDGKPDIVVSLNNIGLFKNTATTRIIDNNSLTAQPDIFLGVSFVNSIGLFDLTGDGKADILRNSSSAPGIFQNLSLGIDPNPFVFGSSISSGVSTNDAFLGYPAGDLNLDGKIDLMYVGGRFNLVMNQQRSDTLGSFNLNDFSGSPNPFTLYSGSTLGGAISADLDSDGKTDIAFISRSENLIKIFRNNLTVGDRDGWIDKLIGTDLPADGNTIAMEVIDLDGDGDLDLVVTSQDSDQLSIYPNQSIVGAIRFGTAIHLSTENDPTLVKAADLNGDGKPDLICIYNSVSKISIFQNIHEGALSTSSFSSRVDFDLPASPRGLDVGDMDLDQKPDLVVGLTNSTIAILKNQINTSAPEITISRNPDDVSGCVMGTVQFQIGASGVTNLQYQWQQNTGGGFVDISDSQKFSGTNTAILTIQDLDFDQNGDQFRCMVSGDNANPVISENAVLSVIAVSPPTVTNGQSCKPDRITLIASGATNGNFRWYSSEAAEDIISGQTSSTFTTPNLSETTSFYVSIVKSNCESDRIEVVAEIDPIPAPEITASGPLEFCQGQSVILSGPAGFPVYRWSNGANTQQVEIRNSTTISLQVGNGECLSKSSESLLISANEKPDQPEIFLVNDLLWTDKVDGANYQWYYQKEIIEGANSHILALDFQTSGDYVLEISFGGECSNQSLPFTYLVTNISNKPNREVNIYPNPFENYLYLRRLTGSENLFIEIWSIHGKQKKVIQKFPKAEKSEFIIETHDLPVGLYLIKVFNKEENTYQVAKLLKR